MHFDRQILYLALVFAAERVAGLAIDRSRPYAIERDSILDTAPQGASRDGRLLSDAHPRRIESASREATPRLSYNADPDLDPFMHGATTFLSAATAMRSSTFAAATPDAQRSSRPHHELRQETGSGPTGIGETAFGPTASGETAFGPTASGETASGPTASGELSAGPTASGETASGPTASRIVPASFSQSSGPSQSSGLSQSSNVPSQSSSLPPRSSNAPSQSSHAPSSSDPPSQSSTLPSSSSIPPSQSSFSSSSKPTTSSTSHHLTFTTRTPPTTHTTHTISTQSASPTLSHTTTSITTGVPGNGTQASVGSHPISNASVAGIASGLAAGAVLVSLAGLYLYRRKKQGKPLFGPRGSKRSTGSFYPKSAWLYDPQPSPTHSRAGSDSGQNLIPEPRPDTVEMDGGGGLASPDMRPSRSSSPLLPPAITLSRDESPGRSPGSSPRRSGGRRSRPMMSINEVDE